MNRISRHQMWMEMAEVAAKRSTCGRANNGALLVRGNNVLSIGYNGPASGEEHCQGRYCEQHPGGGCKRSLHAEANAIKRCALPVEGATLYCTMLPCNVCADLCRIYGVREIYYRHPYRDVSSLSSLWQHGIKTYRVTQNGEIIDDRTYTFIDSAVEEQAADVRVGSATRQRLSALSLTQHG